MRAMHMESIGLAVVASLLGGVQTLRASVITFDTAGYSANGTVATGDGNGTAINGQGDSSKWADAVGATDFAVVANAGPGGNNNALVSTASPTNTQSATYTPSLAELGASSWNASGQQTFSFDIRLFADSTWSSSTEVCRIMPGLQSSSISPLTLSIRAGGDLRLLDNGGNALATFSGALTDHLYHTVSGVIDYSTNRCTVTLDGTSTNSAPFVSPGETSYGSLKLNIRTATNATNGIAIDNISFGVAVPEPAVASLLGLAGGLGLLARRRRVATEARS